MYTKNRCTERVREALLFLGLVLGILPPLAQADPPKADAGPDQTLTQDLFTGAGASLQGGGSSDPGGNPLAYLWLGPFGTQAGAAPAVAMPPGRHRATLVVDNGREQATDSAWVQVDPCFTVQARSKPGLVQLVWTHRPGTLRYDIFRADQNAPQAFTKIGETTSSYSLYPDDSVTNEKGYLYRVAAISDQGDCFSEVTATVAPGGRYRRGTLPPNHAPLIHSTPIEQAWAGIPYDYDVAAHDPDPGDVLSYHLLTAPAGMGITAADGFIAWNPGAAGSYAVTIEVRDGRGGSSRQSFNLVVGEIPPPAGNLPPFFRSQPLTEGRESEAYTYPAEAGDPNPGDTLRYSLTQAPSGMTVASDTGRIDWTPPTGQAGPHGVVLRVTDGDGLYVEQRFIVTVEPANPNQAPVLDPLPDQTAVLGRTLEIQAMASDPDGDPLAFSLPQSPPGMSIDKTTGRIRWTPTADRLGANPVQVRVEDPGGLSDARSFSIGLEINGPPVANHDRFSTRRDQTLQVFAPGVLGNDSDPNGDPLRAEGPAPAPVRGILALADDGAFDYQPLPPPPASTRPVLKYSWVNPGGYRVKVMSGIPLVIDLDGDGVPEILFREGAPFLKGRLVAIHGDDASLYFSRTVADLTPDGGAAPYLCNRCDLAAGDLDGDGTPEIIAVDGYDGAPGGGDSLRRSLHAFTHDGRYLWTSADILSDPAVTRASGFRRATLADLDNDGRSEIIVGYVGRGPTTRGAEFVTVFEHDGRIRWTAHGNNVNEGLSPATGLTLVLDLDLDGNPEILFGDDVYDHTGKLLWSAGRRVREAAAANLDDDPWPEIVYRGVSNSNALYVYEHDGTPKWGPVNLPGYGGYGPLALGDADGDGDADILAADFGYLSAFEGSDGTRLWSTRLPEDNVYGGFPTLFDLDQDGNPEVIYHGLKTLYILDGRDGRILHSLSARASDWMNQLSGPVIADVDGDGAAEIVIGNNSGYLPDDPTLYVFEGENDAWGPTRPVWNQHSYHVTNVDPDGRIPAAEQPYWLLPGLNAYRVNRPLPEEDETLQDVFGYRASDGALSSEPATVVIDILPPNGEPRILSAPPAGASPGFELVHQVQAADPDPGSSLSFALVDAVAGMSIDPDTGVLRWTPVEGQLGPHGVTVEVRDDQGAVVYQHFTLEVSPPVSVPDITGLAAAGAEAGIGAAGLRVGSSAQSYSDSIAEGLVLGQQPPPGTLVAAGSRVDYTLSRGPEPVVVPDLQGMLQKAAEDRIGGAGLILGNLTLRQSPRPRGRVVGQNPPAGARLPPGSTVDLELSVGPALTLRLPEPVINAGESVAFQATAYDANGDPLNPQPDLQMELLYDPAEVLGAAPLLAGGQIRTAADTRGGYRLRVRWGSEQAEARFVVIGSPADGPQQALFSAFARGLEQMARDLDEMEAAVVNDPSAVAPIMDRLRALRDGIDPAAYRVSTVFAPDGGFPPTPQQLTDTGYPETPQDAEFHALTGELLDKLAEVTAWLQGFDPGAPYDDDIRFGIYNAELSDLLNRLQAANPGVHGIVRASSRINQLFAVGFPAWQRALVDRLEAQLRQTGLISALTRDPAAFYAARTLPGGQPAIFYDGRRPAFFTLASQMLANSVQVQLVRRIYLPYIAQVAKGAALLITNDLLRSYYNFAQIDAVITGSSLSFHFFGRDNSAIEGLGFTREGPARSDVWLIGPELIDKALELINGARGVKFKNLNQVNKRFGEIKGLLAAYDAFVTAYNEANSSPNQVVRGCLFNSDPDCSTLVYWTGFQSVYKQGSIPAPVLVMVRNLDSGQWASTVASFLPRDN